MTSERSKNKISYLFMKKQSLIYLALIVLIVLVFLGGGYFAFYQFKKEITENTTGITENTTGKIENTTEKKGPLLKLKPEEYDRDELLDATIVAIDLNKEPKEIDVTVALSYRYLNPPVPSLRRTILVNEKTRIGVGNAYEVGFTELINVTDLSVGDRLLVFVVESTLELLERKEYTAYGIKLLRFPEDSKIE